MKLKVVAMCLMSAAFVMIGAGMLGYGLWMAWWATQAATWPSTPGKITDVCLKEKHGRGKTYQVLVTYEYSAFGKPHTGSRIAYGYEGDGNQKAQELLFVKLKTASAVGVRYDPVSPETSVLSAGVNRSLQTKLIFAAFWTIFAAFIGVFSRLISQGDDVLLKNLSLH